MAWAYNQGSPGHMVGADALFLRPCASCAGGVSTVAFHLGGTSTGAFTAPETVTFAVTAAGTTDGAIWAQFSLPWPGGTAIKINYGGAAGREAVQVGRPPWRSGGWLMPALLRPGL